MQKTEGSEEASSDKELLEEARERFKLAEESESSLRALALEDLKFSAGEQWDPQVKATREQERRPCLTINRLQQFIHQIANDQRQNRPAIKISPVDDKADPETAKIYQGMIRHIEYSSNADTAYDTAFDSAARCGFGFFRVVTEYCDPMSFDQDIRIKLIRNRFSAHLDPSYQEPDGSDANWGFIFDYLTKEEFEEQYPDSEMSSSDDWGTGDSGGWQTESKVRVAEYYYKENQKIKLALLSNGMICDKAKLDMEELAARGVTITQERESVIPQIKWVKINGSEILERTDIPGRFIPIVPVLGEDLDIDGERMLSGLVRHSKDSQRMYNYWASSETETISLAPKAPYIIAEGQVEGQESAWKTANIKNHAFLQYKPKALNGTLLPPPTRNVFEPPIQAITQARMQSSEDMKATTGIYDAALGARSNETSGIAIQRRNSQAQTSNFHFVDNLSKSIRHCGRILLDWIPEIYDTERACRILGEDGSEEVVRINQEFEHKGKKVRYQMGVGKYDVTVSTGPSYETKRQEAVATISDLTKAYPTIMQVAGDLLLGNMDIPAAKEIAERLKKTLPPGIGDDDKGAQKIPPQVQAQMQQMSQMIEQLTQTSNQAHDAIEKRKFEIESRERIAMAELQAKIEIEMAKMGSQEAQALLQHEVGAIKHQLEMLHMANEQQIQIQNGSAGSYGAETSPDDQQQPTGGQSPGNYMGEQP